MIHFTGFLFFWGVETSFVSKEGLVGNTLQWELIFMGQEAGKVDAAGKQQHTAYE